jgi:CHAT domain-containing protein
MRDGGPISRAAWRAIIVGAAIIGVAAPARAAPGLDDLCATQATADPAKPANAPLDTATGTAETMLATAPDRVAVADQAITMLSAAAPEAAGPTQQELAAYCAAAGEAYRLGKAGNPYQARTLLQDALRHADAAGSPRLAALAAYRLALVAGSAGPVRDGRGVRRSIAFAPRGVSETTTATTDPMACARLADPGMEAQGPTYYASAALECAQDRAAGAGDDPLAARSAFRLARLWLDFARRSANPAPKVVDRARAIALDALGVAARIPDPALRVELLGRLADLALAARPASDPRLIAAAAAMRRSATDPASRATAEALAGRLALVAGDTITAAAHIRRAIFLEGQAPVPWRLADWHLLLADADPAGRDAHVTEAFRALDAIRPLLPTYDALTEQSNFTLRVRPIFEAAIATALATAPSADDSARIDLVQAVVEAYRQAELQSLFGSECVPSRPPIRPGELKPGEVLLYPVLLPDRIELLYAVGAAEGSGETPRYHRLAPVAGVGRADVVALIDAVVDATSYGNDDSWRAPARRLYRLLIQPIEDKLHRDGTLVIVPDGPLSALPFAALLDAQDHYLIERSRVAIVPALAFAQPGRTTEKAPIVVAVTLERRVVMPFGSFSALVGTGAEAEVAVGNEKGRNLLIRNFHRADLDRALARQGVDVLHLATHASFNGRSDRSYIVADGELIPISDLRDMIERSQTRGSQLDLLVLSACETAVGDDQAGMGLAGAAVQAGAHSALASLWEVNDAGTAELMKTFYARYRAGAGKAEALHDAQLALIARGGDLADPNIWAAFTLLGGWR